MAETSESTFDKRDLSLEGLYLNDLLPALQRLDGLLEQAIRAARESHGPGAAADPYRGLYISQDEVERLLAHEPGAPTLHPDGEDLEAALPDAATGGSRLAWLKDAFGLSSFDLDLILIALAPELDRRYERLYAYLQDHVSRRRPSVDLALSLLCGDAVARLERRAHFDPDSPLLREGLIHLTPEPDGEPPSLLAHTLKLDEQIVRFLLRQDGLDSRLAPFCQLVFSLDTVEELPLDAEVRQALPALVARAWEENQPLRLYFHGPPGAGKRRAAAALAAKAGAPLLIVDLARALAATLGFGQVLQLAFRYGWLEGAIPYLDGLDGLRSDGWAIPYGRLLEALAQDAGFAILAGEQPWTPSAREPLGVIPIPFPIPSFTQRRDCWQANLDAVGIALDGYDLDTLAGRFRLTPGQIAGATVAACNRAAWRAAARSDDQLSERNGQSTLQDLFAAARAQSGHDLDRLARRIEPLYSWDDIVLPQDTLAQLREICQRVAHRHRVLGEWGFDRKLSLGKGVTALFAGPSGTGKTMAAEIIAGELGLDLYKIDLSGVVSKYVGETEKNLDRIFAAAENANAILFFDEADALFGKRSEVRDSHDRYANIEISYLLQKMEEYEGIAILATNLRQNLDESFVRRLAFTVHFPFPDEDSRRRIWAGIWPDATPLAQDVDPGFLARQFRLSGGNIKNIALAGAFLAADDGGAVTMVHLVQATRREYQKMGKALSETELEGLLNSVRSQTAGNVR
jgi:SpoVK/Ycf46/Vps4 family AAA+-type ATPase